MSKTYADCNGTVELLGFIQAIGTPSDYYEYSSDDAMKPYLLESGGRPIGFSHHRDSDLLAESNWDVISKDLTTRFPDVIAVFGASHWAVGWVEGLRIQAFLNEDDPLYEQFLEALEAVLEWHKNMEDYCVADEDDFSAREQEEKQRYFDEFLYTELKTYAVENELPEFTQVVMGEDGEWGRVFIEDDTLEEALYYSSYEWTVVEGRNAYISESYYPRIFEKTLDPVWGSGQEIRAWRAEFDRKRIAPSMGEPDAYQETFLPFEQPTEYYDPSKHEVVQLQMPDGTRLRTYMVKGVEND